MEAVTIGEIESQNAEGSADSIEQAVRAALETYANVHRGSGHHSAISTHLYERAREIVLEHLGLDGRTHAVVFCSPRRAASFERRLEAGSVRSVSSADLGLPIGVRALAIPRAKLPRGVPFESGGGAAKLVGRDWVIWAEAPDRFEAGTPAVVNVVALAKALRLEGRDARGRPDASAEVGAGAAREVREILYRGDFEGLVGRDLLDALVRTRMGRGALVPTAEGPAPFTNLDNAASTPAFEPIFDAYAAALRLPESARREIVRETASICATALGAPLGEYDVLFTSNATEALNLVAESLGREGEEGIEPVVLTTILEHSSNDLPWRAIPGGSVVRLPVDAEGFLDPAALEAALRAHNEEGRRGRKRVRLVALSGASNVYGSCNDIAEAARLAHLYGARLLVDGAQLVAHRPVEIAAWGADYFAFSAHKVYAPFGAGALIARRGLLRFAPDELREIRASGEENAAGVAALGRALVLLGRIGMDVVAQEERALTQRALTGLSHLGRVTVHGLRDPGSPRFDRKLGVIAFDVRGSMAPRVARALAERGGIGVRAGCHCAHLAIKNMLGIGPFLERFQGLIQRLFPRLKLPGVVRVSFGLENRGEDVDRFLTVLDGIARDRKTPPEEVRRQIDDLSRASAERIYSRS